MKNQNQILIKKVNEERYFKNYNDLYNFVIKSIKVSESFLFENETLRKTVVEPILKNDGSHFCNIGGFICLLTIGHFDRTSGNYKYNLLSVQNSKNLCYNDIRTILNF